MKAGTELPPLTGVPQQRDSSPAPDELLALILRLSVLFTQLRRRMIALWMLSLVLIVTVVCLLVVSFTLWQHVDELKAASLSLTPAATVGNNETSIMSPLETSSHPESDYSGLPCTVFVVNANSRLFAYPDPNSSVVMRLAAQTALQSIGRTKDNLWTQVSLGAAKGWISARALTDTGGDCDIPIIDEP
jgi:hypothetical protein